MWLTSGSRLAVEMRADWCELVLRALERHPTVHWVVAGSGEAVPAAVPRDHPRVHVLPFVMELPRLMLRCTLHLNPPRVGGGQTVAMAMAHGLPTVSLALGDGGDKLGDAALHKRGDVATLIDAWMESDELRLGAAESQRRRFVEVFDVDDGGRGASRLLGKRPAIPS